MYNNGKHSIIAWAASLLILVSVLPLSLLGVDSRNYTVTAEYCDGSTLEIYPYSFVTPGEGTAFECYDAAVTPVAGGYRYGFEDKDDADYNDLIVELWVTGQGTANPTAHVRYVSKDASYKHWLYLVYNGTAVLVFKAEDSSPGSVFDIPLPETACPDFEIAATPASQEITQGESASYTVALTALHDFASPVTLSLSNLPAGLTADFSPNPVSPTGECTLDITSTGDAPVGTHNLVVTGKAGDKAHDTALELIIHEAAPPEPTKPPVFTGELEKAFTPGEALPGDEVTIFLRLRNTADGDFEDITLRDELPAGLEYLEDDAPVRLRRSGQKLVWVFPLVKAKQSLLVKVKVFVAENTPAGTIRNTAYLSHCTLEQDIASNEAELQVREIRATLEKSVDKTVAGPGDTLKYRITLHNLSTVTLEGIELKDDIPASLEILSTGKAGEFSLSRRGLGLTWKGSLLPGKRQVFTIDAKIKADTLSGTRIENLASMEAGLLDETLFSNTVLTRVSSLPVPSSRVCFRKRAEVPQAEVGRILRFRLTLENRSTSPLIAPQIEDHLPQGFDYVAQSTLVDNQSYTEPSGKRRLLWQLPQVKAGQTLVLRYQVVIGSDVRRGKNVNRAVLSTQDTSGQPIRLEDSAFVNVSADSYIFYSGVTGTVYLDRDGDDFYSMADTPLPDIEMRLSTGEKAMTDSMGRYAFEGLFPGEYALGVNRAALPERYRLASPFPRVVVLSDGLSDTVDFAVKFQGEDETGTARLQGRVFYDKNRDLVFNGGDIPAEKFTARLDGKLIAAGKNGSFVFTHLKPGFHTIEIIYGPRTVKKAITLKQGKNYIDIPLIYSGITIIIKGEEQ